MTTLATELAQLYATALRAYLAKGDEGGLQDAYEIGRKTIAEGLGVMELAKAHEEAVVALFTAGSNPADNARLCRLTAAFFSESLWPFEMMQRGFCESNLKLRDLNAVLQNRAVELALTNDALNQEIAERKRVEQALRRSEENLQALSKQILTAQEEERKRISRELHDEVGQALTAINMNLTMLKKQAPTPSLASSFADLQNVLQQTMETVHNFTRELRPSMLDHLGLVPTLQAYVRNFCKRTGLRVGSCRGSGRRSPGDGRKNRALSSHAGRVEQRRQTCPGQPCRSGYPQR